MTEFTKKQRGISRVSSHSSIRTFLVRTLSQARLSSGQLNGKRASDKAASHQPPQQSRPDSTILEPFSTRSLTA